MYSEQVLGAITLQPNRQRLNSAHKHFIPYAVHKGFSVQNLQRQDNNEDKTNLFKPKAIV